MKKILLAATVAVACSATAANAASTATLQVKGLLTNAACTPVVNGGAEVDYGRIHLSELSATSVNQLGHKTANLVITCPTATKAAWTISDDRADSHPGASVISISNGDYANATVSDTTLSYGVGLAGNVKIGAFSVYTDLANVTADSVKVDAISSAVSTTAWAKSTSGAIKNGNLEMMSVAASGTTEPVAFTTATFPLITSLAIQDTATLAITDDTNLDGQATITIKYL